MFPVEIYISDYDYHLPDDRIARYPLPERDTSKMLVYEDGKITHSSYAKLAEHIEENSLLVLNDTRVVHARLLFCRSTGGEVEVFCLSPLEPHTEVSKAMAQQGNCVWLCLAKKLKKWKVGESLILKKENEILLTATLIKREEQYATVAFKWTPDTMPFSSVLLIAGDVPLPPYLHRHAEPEDNQTYQTVYAENAGAVAAPTAGLHFTERVFTYLKKKNIEVEKITLHVSAGTFLPVEVNDVLQHPMHNEQLIFSRDFIEKTASTKKKIIPVGTTSLRALESLYWFGKMIFENSETENFFITKMYPYSGGNSTALSAEKSMNFILQWMQKRNMKTLTGSTEIFILPGYDFKICSGLITNFHQPQSTLLLLISSILGNEWKSIYNEALDNDYRFLSYGDGMYIKR